MKIYHNTRCKKSRAALEYLKNRTNDVEVIEYLKIPFTEKKFRELLLKMNVKFRELARQQEEFYKKELKGKNFTDDEWIKIFLENPNLIHRPIVEARYKAVLAQPPEKIDELF